MVQSAGTSVGGRLTLIFAGFRILQTIAPKVSHSKYQDVDILNFYVKIRRLDL